MNLKELGIYDYQIIPSRPCNRKMNPNYFKRMSDSDTSPQLNTRIVQIKGVDFDHLKV